MKELLEINRTLGEMKADIKNINTKLDKIEKRIEVDAPQIAFVLRMRRHINAMWVFISGGGLLGFLKMLNIL